MRYVVTYVDTLCRVDAWANEPAETAPHMVVTCEVGQLGRVVAWLRASFGGRAPQLSPHMRIMGFDGANQMFLDARPEVVLSARHLRLVAN